MFTRCPGCHTVHPLNAGLLAQGNGLYRCGKCGKVSNALQNLFDSWPEAGDKPSSDGVASRQPPVLETKLELHAAAEDDGRGPLPEDMPPLPADIDLQGEPVDHSRGRKVWTAAAIVMVAVTMLNLFFVSGDALLAQPSIRSALQKVGAMDAPPEPVYRNLELLHLASSEMHSHPTLDETLVLNATIVNRADKKQPFPALQVTLFDAQNQPLASRLFSPHEYLPPTSGSDPGMPPGAYLPVIMELLDPGDHAVGFEMKFH